MASLLALFCLLLLFFFFFAQNYTVSCVNTSLFFRSQLFSCCWYDLIKSNHFLANKIWWICCCFYERGAVVSDSILAANVITFISSSGICAAYWCGCFVCLLPLWLLYIFSYLISIFKWLNVSMSFVCFRHVCFFLSYVFFFLLSVRRTTAKFLSDNFV